MGVWRDAFAAADELGGGEAVEALHLHVEEDDGEVLLEQQAQRVVAGANRDQVLAEVRQDGLQGQEVGRLVVHQQNVRAWGGFVAARYYPACSASNWTASGPFADGIGSVTPISYILVSRPVVGP